MHFGTVQDLWSVLVHLWQPSRLPFYLVESLVIADRGLFLFSSFYNVMAGLRWEVEDNTSGTIRMSEHRLQKQGIVFVGRP